jgi:pSer/pThr/pTyr-binding forkhead associated (FHA) protein
MRNLLLENDELLLGSDVDCSAHLPYRFVSTRHCLLQRTGHQWMLVDLDSANGTLVNGVRCPEKVLVAGDILQVGEVTILYLPPMDELGTTPSE